VTKWDVDIISMSFGLRGPVDEVRAVIEAYCHKKIMFAAASNNGGNFGRAYPADDLNVICMHSTDGEGNKSKFSPSPQEDRPNFSILGESVESSWPPGVEGCQQPVRCMSGTSVATPIAAGVAATVLAFARHHEQKGDERLVKLLNSPRCMVAILRLMVECKRDKYDYITPWWLFKPYSSSSDVYRNICETIKVVFGSTLN
jgi:Subtilase family